MKKAAAAACVGFACAGTPKLHIEAPRKDCAPEVVEWMEANGFFLGGKIGNIEELTMVLDAREPVPAPPEGPLVIYAYNDFRGSARREATIFPRGSRLLGQAFRGTDRLYGWLTELETPDGKRYPICGNLVNPSVREEMGTPFQPGSTPERPLVRPRVIVMTAKRLGVFR
ncbi:hypothetical protein ACLESD_46325 [Pyxidicoccus sp. 3LFB2]